ncbi:11841_t:CDS:2, partial [Scutellospora calospora]
GILHYDIRTSNILLNEHLQPKLYNFQITEKSTPPIFSTLRWNSPEVINGEEYNKASEVYSFALVMWAIEYQQMPFINLTSEEEVRRLILNKTRPELKSMDGIPVGYQEIIKKSWSHDPLTRLNMKEILERLNRLDLENFTGLDSDDYFDFNIANIEIPNAAKSKYKEEFEMYQKYSLSIPKEIEQGIEFHKNKNYESAWEKFYRFHQLNPEDPHTNFWVGFYYFKGHHIEKNVRSGMNYLKKASDLQHPDAQYWYASTLLNSSDEFEKDRYAAAMKYLRISAMMNSKALRMLGRIVQTGNFGQNANYLVGQAMIDRAHRKIITL